jgi:hypothetical protein
MQPSLGPSLLDQNHAVNLDFGLFWELGMGGSLGISGVVEVRGVFCSDGDLAFRTGQEGPCLGAVDHPWASFHRHSAGLLCLPGLQPQPHQPSAWLASLASSLGSYLADYTLAMKLCSPGL